MKLSKIFFFAGCLLMWAQANATLKDLEVLPASVSVKADTTITLNTAGTTKNTSLANALDKTAPAPILRISPASFGATWDVTCSGELNAVTSPRGIFSISGKDIANNTFRLTTGPPPCPSGSNLLAETVFISKQLSDAVLNEILRTTRVSEVNSSGRLTKNILLEYRRTFSVPAKSLTRVMTVAFELQAEVSVNSSQLISVGTRGQSTLIPVNAGAGAIPAVPVTWVASIESSGKGKSLTIRSDGIEYRTESGQLIQFQSRPLNKIFNPGFAALDGLSRYSLRALLKGLRQTLINDAFAAISTIEFRETLSIPKSVLVRARQLGASRIIASRRFSDGTASFSSEFLLPLGASNQFQITRVDLYFPGGVRSKVAGKDVALRVIADINYIGTGQLRGMWEWAPIQPGGVPLYRPLPASLKRVTEPEQDADYYKPRDTLTLVREYLTSFQKVSLRSPVLPTNNEGSYILRLRIDSPEVGFTLPVVQYFINVKPELVDQVKSSIPLLILNPPRGQSAMASTNFKWSSVPETEVYRFEIYLDEGMSSNMVTAALVKKENTSMQISPLVYDHLVSGKTYWFRVVSIDADGRLVASSQLSPLKIR